MNNNKDESHEFVNANLRQVLIFHRCLVFETLGFVYIGILIKHFFFYPAVSLKTVSCIILFLLVLIEISFRLKVRSSNISNRFGFFISNTGLTALNIFYPWTKCKRIEKVRWFGVDWIKFQMKTPMVFHIIRVSNYNPQNLKYLFEQYIPSDMVYKVDTLNIFKDIEAIKPSLQKAIESKKNSFMKSLLGLVFFGAIMGLINGLLGDWLIGILKSIF